MSKDNAEQVALHLIMAGRLLDTDPELAYEHAQAAVRRAGRVDVVREAAGLAAYRTGRFAEALRELRTVRRLNGSSEHLAIMADCERGLGRPERAIALAASDEAGSLEADEQVELAMVVSGARLDLGEAEAALAVLSSGAPARVTAKDGVVAARVAHARASALEALGRHDEAAAVLAPFSAAQLSEAAGEVDAPVVVFDLAEEPEDDAFGPDAGDTDPVVDDAPRADAEPDGDAAPAADADPADDRSSAADAPPARDAVSAEDAAPASGADEPGPDAPGSDDEDTQDTDDSEATGAGREEDA